MRAGAGLATQAAIDRVMAVVDGNQADILATLVALINVPSVNPNYPRFPGVPGGAGETAANEVLRPVYEAARCEIDSFEVVTGRANLVGIRPGRGEGRSLILNGHVDTVAPGDPARWASGHPFEARVQDGKVYGLGASDMKAGLVAQAWAVRALEEAGVQLQGDLILQSVVGEELMEHQAGTTATVERGYRADAAVVGEPTGLLGSPTLAPCSGGGTIFTLRIEGLATHICARGALVWPGGGGEKYGVNAIEKAFYIAQGLKKLEADWGLAREHPLFPPGHFTIGPDNIFGSNHGEMLSWAVANECTLEYLVMYEPERPHADVVSEIESYLDRLYDQDPWLRDHRPAIAWPHDWPPYSTPTDHPFVSVVASAHAQALGEPVTVQGFLAVDDATYLERAGIPSVTYGPGSLLNCHCYDEYVTVDDLIRACRVYAATAIAWCGVAS